jgi:Protein of unknown function (DUF2934)
MDKYDLNTDDSQIEKLAYQIWEERGRPQGSPDEDWFRAKRKLLQQSQSLSNLLNRSQLPFSSIRMGY